MLPPTLGCRIAAIAGDWSSLSRMAKKSPVFGHRRFESYNPNKYASVAQWIRASRYEREGRRFDSCRKYNICFRSSVD